MPVRVLPQAGTLHWTVQSIQIFAAQTRHSIFLDTQNVAIQKNKNRTETINKNNDDNSDINSKGTGNNIIPTFPRLAGLYSPANQNQQSSQYRCKSAEKEDRSSVLPVWHLHIGPAAD